jgi:hypothetical protein
VAGAWGTGSYGTGPYGGSGGSAISISGARALSTHSVVVTLSSAPQNEDPFKSGDVLNPQTWTVQQLVSLDFFTIIAVRCHDALLNEFEIQTLEPLDNHLIQHQVKSLTLRSAGGVLVTAPHEADFAGLVEEIDPVAKTEQRRFPTRDLANPPTPAESGEGGIGGTLRIDSDGDYATVAGVELVKKLVLRRLFTKRGGFFHLPNYGFGLGIKEPVLGGDVITLKADLERAMKLEPDVDRALATVQTDRRGILTLLLRFTLAGTGQEIKVGVQSDPSTGNVVEL